LHYSLEENDKKYGSMNTAPCTAIWSSGARKRFSNSWDLNEFPDGVMETLQRPNVAGYSQDAEFALKVQQMKNQKAQAQSEAAQRSYNNIMQGLKDTTPKTTKTNCYNTYGGVSCNSTTY